MSLGNPVPGIIQAKEEAWDGRSFRVTATFADHRARKPPQNATDIGNGRCGAGVLAVANGTVAQIVTDPNGARIVRVKHDGTLDSTGYAHLDQITVKVGQKVKRGQQLGTVGKTGAVACHLHIGLVRGGVPIDIWPELDQNQLPDSSTGDDVNPNTSVPIATCTVLPGGTMYGDETRQTVLAANWAGGTNIGIYALPRMPTTGGKASLCPIRVDLAGGPAEDLRIGWVGRDKVTNISGGAASQDEIDAAEAKVAGAVAAAAVTEANKYR